jgi:hypothetical protein
MRQRFSTRLGQKVVGSHEVLFPIVVPCRDSHRPHLVIHNIHPGLFRMWLTGKTCGVVRTQSHHTYSMSGFVGPSGILKGTT